MCKVKRNGPVYYMSGDTTVCLLVEDEKVTSRGISVHSRADEFDPKLGRKNALDIAREASGRKINVGKIDLYAVRFTPFDWFSLSLAKDAFGEYRGSYLPKLTATEELLIKTNGKTMITESLDKVISKVEAKKVETVKKVLK